MRLSRIRALAIVTRKSLGFSHRHITWSVLSTQQRSFRYYPIRKDEQVRLEKRREREKRKQLGFTDDEEKVDVLRWLTPDGFDVTRRKPRKKMQRGWTSQESQLMGEISMVTEARTMPLRAEEILMDKRDTQEEMTMEEQMTIEDTTAGKRDIDVLREKYMSGQLSPRDALDEYCTTFDMLKTCHCKERRLSKSMPLQNVAFYSIDGKDYPEGIGSDLLEAIEEAARGALDEIFRVTYNEQTGDPSTSFHVNISEEDHDFSDSFEKDIVVESSQKSQESWNYMDFYRQFKKEHAYSSRPTTVKSRWSFSENPLTSRLPLKKNEIQQDNTEVEVSKKDGREYCAYVTLKSGKVVSGQSDISGAHAKAVARQNAKQVYGRRREKKPLHEKEEDSPTWRGASTHLREREASSTSGEEEKEGQMEEHIKVEQTIQEWKKVDEAKIEQTEVELQKSNMSIEDFVLGDYMDRKFDTTAKGVAHGNISSPRFHEMKKEEKFLARHFNQRNVFSHFSQIITKAQILEAERYAKQMVPILNTMMMWSFHENLFRKDTMKYQTGRVEDRFSYSDFQKNYDKWQDTVVKVLMGCLDTEEQRVIKNALHVLKEIGMYLPATPERREELRSKVEKINNSIQRVNLHFAADKCMIALDAFKEEEEKIKRMKVENFSWTPPQEITDLQVDFKESQKVPMSESTTEIMQEEESQKAPMPESMTEIKQEEESQKAPMPESTTEMMQEESKIIPPERINVRDIAAEIGESFVQVKKEEKRKKPVIEDTRTTPKKVIPKRATPKQAVPIKATPLKPVPERPTLKRATREKATAEEETSGRVQIDKLGILAQLRIEVGNLLFHFVSKLFGEEKDNSKTADKSDNQRSRKKKNRK